MNRRISTVYTVLLLCLFGALGALYYFKAEWTPPELALTPDQPKVGPKTVFSIIAADRDSDLRSLRVVAHQGSDSIEIMNKSLPAGTRQYTEQFSLPKTGIKNAPLTLEIIVRDTSWHRFGRGNKAQIVREMEIDSRPPMISVLSGQHNVNQGGTGLVVYSTNEELTSSGVRLGDDYFFPGYPYQPGKYLCFFAIPHDFDAKAVPPVLHAVDMADNEVTTGFHFRMLAKKFKQDTINISENFLNSKMGQFADLYPDLTRPIDIFLKVNSDLRRKNIESLKSLGRDTVPQQLWEGTFIRLPNSAPMAGFADHRTYLYQGKTVDNQTHMGVDLASLAMAPIPAGNTGRVILAEFMGIYGNVVIIDHGFGLQSLYSHMSEIHVHKGETVQRGQIIGKTGATGMAGGDHLHFGILVSGLEVQPIEWWDPNWIKNNITSKM